VPTVADRIAQTVVKMVMEPVLEPKFLQDSYGYRPNRSALDAVAITRERCWKYDWCLEFDIRGLFDNLSHELLKRAVEKHIKEKWVLLYIGRWMKAPLQLPKGELQERKSGVPQGGCISPILSNLFLHYAFDVWMQRNYPAIRWVRYADDGLLHCQTYEEAEGLLKAITKRFTECGLELHPEKTRIVYCKDAKRKGEHENRKFDFLGYTFRARLVKSKLRKSFFMGFNPGLSDQALKSMKEKIRKMEWPKLTFLSLQNVADIVNPMLRGWVNYYGRFSRAEMYKLWRYFNQTLITWLVKKYKSFRKNRANAGEFLERLYKEESDLFVHWELGMFGSLT
jgi:RNA-directed DNA polymerase